MQGPDLQGLRRALHLLHLSWTAMWACKMCTRLPRTWSRLRRSWCEQPSARAATETRWFGGTRVLVLMSVGQDSFCCPLCLFGAILAMAMWWAWRTSALLLPALCIFAGYGELKTWAGFSQHVSLHTPPRNDSPTFPPFGLLAL